MSLDDDGLTGALDALTIRSNDGRPALMIGLLATLYFENGWTRPVREAVAAVAESYIDRFQDKIRWAEHPATGHIHPISSKHIKRPSQWLPQHRDGEEWEFGYHGGEEAADAAAFAIQANCTSPTDPRPGDLTIHLPINYFTQHGGTFAEFLLPICRQLKPISGIAGIGFLESMDGMRAAESFPLIRKLAEQHPALEIHSVVTCNHVGTGIKGVNWLTILGECWIQELGGLDYLRVRLDEPTFPFYPYDGGVIIQAGTRPQIGDASKDLWPKDYITLHKVLKRIQIKEHYAFHFRRPKYPGEMDYDASRAWIFRFDGK